MIKLISINSVYFSLALAATIFLSACDPLTLKILSWETLHDKRNEDREFQKIRVSLTPGAGITVESMDFKLIDCYDRELLPIRGYREFLEPGFHISSCPPFMGSRTEECDLLFETDCPGSLIVEYRYRQSNGYF